MRSFNTRRLGGFVEARRMDSLEVAREDVLVKKSCIQLLGWPEPVWLGGPVATHTGVTFSHRTVHIYRTKTYKNSRSTLHSTTLHEQISIYKYI